MQERIRCANDICERFDPCMTLDTRWWQEHVERNWGELAAQCEHEDLLSVLVGQQASIVAFEVDGPPVHTVLAELPQDANDER